MGLWMRPDFTERIRLDALSCGLGNLESEGRVGWAHGEGARRGLGELRVVEVLDRGHDVGVGPVDGHV